MRQERRSTLALAVLLAAVILMAVTYRAEAHTSAELDAWKVGWVERADISLSDALFYEWDDMRDRHPWYWNPPAETTTTPRAIANSRGVGAGVEQWRDLVAAYFPPNQVDRALCIISRESNGDPNAYNSSSGASGLFQHLPKYWDSRSAKAGWSGASIMDTNANTAVAAWLWTVDGWWHWNPYIAGHCR